MKLGALGKLGELCNEASVPILPPKEQVIGFRQLQYTIRRPGLLGKEVLPRTAGWVYVTSRRILLLDDGWTEKGGARWKRYHEIAFEEAQGVRHKIANRVLVDLVANGEAYAAAFTPYGPSARLFDWLKKQKEKEAQRQEGTLVSPYAKDRWYRHPPK